MASVPKLSGSASSPVATSANNGAAMPANNNGNGRVIVDTNQALTNIGVKTLSTGAVTYLLEFINNPFGRVDLPWFGDVSRPMAMAIIAGGSELVSSSVNEFVFSWQDGLPAALGDFADPVGTALSSVAISWLLTGRSPELMPALKLGITVGGASVTGSWLADRIQQAMGN